MFCIEGGATARIPVVAFVGTNLNAANQTTYTFTDEPVGVANHDRVVVVCIGAATSGVSETISSATIGGLSASIINQAATDSGTDEAISGIITRFLPAGTTATIAITFSGACLNCGIAVYTLRGTGGLTAANNTDTTINNSGTATTLDYTLPANSAAVFVSCQDGGSTETCTWTAGTTDPTEDSDFSIEVDTEMSSASIVKQQAAVGVTNTISTWSNTGRVSSCVAVWT